MLYFYDLELVHAFIFIVPCLLLSLAKVIIKKLLDVVGDKKTTLYFYSRSGPNW